tara:strand:+ start:131 stop:607 length:477 start_codon:yes stop_codon:yes gene_type:complete
MKNFFIKIILTTFFLLFTSCGFKVMDNSSLTNFSINKLETFGDKRVNFKLKNDLEILTAETSENFINIKITTNKNKSVKEKNIKNEIEKYKIELKADLQVSLNTKKEIKRMSFLVTGDFLASSTHSKTLNNEKKLVDNLTKDLSKKIRNQIIIYLNDI